MKIPYEVPVMTLSNATLFPMAFMPLLIFEPRYREMLADALHSSRMFSVAMPKHGKRSENPATVGGLGLIRAAVKHKDGTSHVVLEGIARVEIQERVRCRPYRIHRIRPLQTPPCDNVRVDALAAKVRELLADRLQESLPVLFAAFAARLAGSETPPASLTAKDILPHLDDITNPAEVADLAACTLLTRPRQRQAILEAIEVEPRLQRVLHFLLAQSRRRRKTKSS